ncbi:hypothetical protein E0Z10_g6008 [Xylaria hypoxylon]|uniref:Uncharacterized protein n=1 Tax=Xylaria hypoxylon TaxID=37992 RepID=A0A4Z0YUD5_9PEZI|nr:hypothetical protein E0Z10_g6008 [Xylaria hypoxylon]
MRRSRLLASEMTRLVKTIETFMEEVRYLRQRLDSAEKRLDDTAKSGAGWLLWGIEGLENLVREKFDGLEEKIALAAEKKDGTELPIHKKTTY